MTGRTWLVRKRGSRTTNRPAPSLLAARSALALGLTAMPVVGVEIEEKRRAWMLLEDLLVQIEAQARLVEERKMPVDDLGQARSRLLHPRLGKVVEMQLDLEVGHT